MTITQQTHHDRPASHDAPVLAELLGASKQFGKGTATVQAVRGLDLEVRSGELLALLGPNGAGKSTAIGMLTGLTAPTSGRARLFGRDPRALRARQRLGVMLQSSGVPDTLRVRELLTQFRATTPPRCPWRRSSPRRALTGSRAGCSASSPAASSVASCSESPWRATRTCVVFDEPTTGLDVEARHGLWATLRGLAASGRGVVLTTHYLEEADALADRIVVIDRGVVIAEGTPAEIKDRVPGDGSGRAPRWPGRGEPVARRDSRIA